MKKLLAWIGKNEFPVVVITLVVFLRLPSIFEPNWYGDEGIYLVLGKALREGFVWYRQIHDNKPPMIYLLAALAGNVAYFRTLLIGWMVVTMIIFWKLANKMTGNRQAKAALMVFGLLTSLPAIEGNIANAEIFMILPTILGVWLLLKAESFWAGICFGLAFLFKVPAVFEFVGIMIYFLMLDSRRKLRWTLAGFLLPVSLTFIYYAMMGSLNEYISAAFFQNIGYLSSWGTTSKTVAGLPYGLFIRVAILFFVTSILCLQRRKKSTDSYRLIWIWFVFALFGALLSERAYPHYLIQLVASGSFIAVSLFERDSKIRLISAGVLLLMAFSIVKYKFYFYETIGYYRNFAGLVSGKINRDKYYSSFDWRVNRTEAAARYIRSATKKDDKVFIWGDEPFVYLEADRLPAGKYITAYHLRDFSTPNEVSELLIREMPKVILVSTNENRNFSQLNGLLVANYVMVKDFEGLKIYFKL